MIFCLAGPVIKYVRAFIAFIVYSVARIAAFQSLGEFCLPCPSLLLLACGLLVAHECSPSEAAGRQLVENTTDVDIVGRSFAMNASDFLPDREREAIAAQKRSELKAHWLEKQEKIKGGHL